MLNSDKFSYVNIREYLVQTTKSEIGESALIEILSDFSCPKNSDVERFLKKSSIEFVKKNQSVTYLVFAMNDGELLGYFTIALKPLTVRSETVSNTVKRKMQRISELDEQSQTYTMSAYLIAQLGKNYTNGAEKRITGVELLEMALTVIDEMQYAGGGTVAFLETNNDEKLLSFYKANAFQKFDTRKTISSTKEPHELVQMLKLL